MLHGAAVPHAGGAGASWSCRPARSTGSPTAPSRIPTDAAPRELAEETGHRAAVWRQLGRFWTAPGFTDELMHLYLATDLEPLDDYRGPDVDEYLDLVRTALA